ncbi:MAG: DUF192 domain-containing protein [Patescibacteria group bacterium]|nr:DUF192 domain-containing protein [Patescibacteria group bacterium]
MKPKIKIKDVIFIFIVASGLIMLVYQKFAFRGEEGEFREGQEIVSVVVGDSRVAAIVANTDEKRYLGLGNINSLAMDRGMFFIHDETEKHGYSMRGMRFDLDLIFIRDGKVVDIAKNVACEYNGKIEGGTEYDRVLEVNADWARINEVKIGDEVIIE